jgi:hypothetical protein
MALYAWIVVSLTILVGAAILGHVEDEQTQFGRYRAMR